MGFQWLVSQFSKMALIKIVKLLINYGNIFRISEVDCFRPVSGQMIRFSLLSLYYWIIYFNYYFYHLTDFKTSIKSNYYFNFDHTGYIYTDYKIDFIYNHQEHHHSSVPSKTGDFENTE